MFCCVERVVPYFDEPIWCVKIQTMSKNSQRYYTTKCLIRDLLSNTTNYVSVGEFTYGELVTEVCEAERNWRIKSSKLIGQQQESKANLSNQSSGVQIQWDICTRLGCYLYSTKCSWIINTCMYLLLTLVAGVIVLY